MNDGSVVIASPADPKELVLLFHGVGASAAGLVPLGELIAREHTRAMVVSVDAAHPWSLGSGRQWFSVAGVTEQDRPARVAAAMPAFEREVRRWQQQAGVGPEATSLVGFSQGAIMSLESTQAAGLAHRIVSVSGRFAQPPRRAFPAVAYRFVHGDSDPVIDARFSIEAAEALRLLGADATVQLVPGLGHGIDARAARAIVAALS